MREVYVRIDAGPGERIDAVRLSLPAAESGDGLLLDRIAVQLVPEPATALLLAAGLAALARGARARPC
jgi:hypothetical protein